eukprot:212282_1
MGRIYGIYWYRASNETKLICKYNIDEDYVALFLHVPNLPKPHTSAYLGDVYWLNCHRYVENKAFAHPFTTFYNHGHNDIQSFLFSSLMRSFPSHCGHRFPIRPTAEECPHVLYSQVEQPQPSQATSGIPVDFELMRTDTAASVVSVSGLVAVPSVTNKIQSSPSESVKLHALSIEKLQKQQQIKLFKLSENRQHPGISRPFSTFAGSFSVGSEHTLHMANANDMKHCPNPIASEEDDATEEEEAEEDSHQHLNVQTMICDGSVSFFYFFYYYYILLCISFKFFIP